MKKPNALDLALVQNNAFEIIQAGPYNLSAYSEEFRTVTELLARVKTSGQAELELAKREGRDPRVCD